MTISHLFTDHPSSVNETYGEHMKMSATFAFWFFVAGFCALVHAVLPFLFVKTGSQIITRLHTRMVTTRVRHPVMVEPTFISYDIRVQQALESAAL